MLMKMNSFFKTLLFLVTTSVYSQDPLKFQINFESGISALSPRAMAKIDSVIKLCGNELKDFKVAIVGHTDNVGDTSFNQALSLARANETKKYFVGKSFYKDNITASGKGFSNQLNDNSTDDRKFFNRRVSISISRNLAANKSRFSNKLITKINVGGLTIKSNRQIVKSETGSVIKNLSGTSIIIPPMAFVDKKGKPVKGEVVVNYTEYRDPVDFILGGIPMSYLDKGKMYRFNSGGMFKITASLNGEPIYVKQGEQLEVNFALTARLPNMNFYRFDSLSGQWIELAKITGPKEKTSNNKRSKEANKPDVVSKTVEAETDEPKIGNSVSRTLEGYSSNPHGATSCGMPECDAIKAGVLLAEQTTPVYEKIYEPADIYYQNRLKNNNEMDLQLKLANTFKLRLDSIDNVLSKEKRFYKLQMIKESKSKVLFNLSCDAKSNNELEAFKNISWQYSSKNAPRSNAAAFKKKWANCQVLESGGDYKIVLTDSKGEISIQNLQLKPNEKIRKKDKENYIRSVFDNYKAGSEKYKLQVEELSRNRDSIQNQFLHSNTRADSLSKFQNGEDWIYSIFNSKAGSGLCFWQWNKNYMSAQEQTMKMVDWCSYFNEHKAEMAQRYSSIWQNSRQCGSARGSFAICSGPPPSFWSGGSDYKNGNGGLDSLTNSLNQTTSIPMMGIYNFDVPEEIENREEIFVEFKDGQGKEIKPDYVFLVDNSANGLISYDKRADSNPYKLVVMRTSYISLIAIDKNKTAYVYSAKKFEAIRSGKGQVNRTMVLDKIKNLKDKSELEKLL
jgi:hypothetical protein